MASPGINVFSSISMPNRSKSKLAPKANVVSKDATSSLIAENGIAMINLCWQDIKKGQLLYNF